MKMERVSNQIDFDTEFSNLTSTVLSFFDPNELNLIDLQQEFESSARDEELEMDENEENAIITEVGAEQQEKTVMDPTSNSLTKPEDTASAHPARSTSKREDHSSVTRDVLLLEDPITELQLWQEEVKIVGIRHSDEL